MQQDEPYNASNANSALDDYMAALLRDDSVTQSSDGEELSVSNSPTALVAGIDRTVTSSSDAQSPTSDSDEIAASADLAAQHSLEIIDDRVMADSALTPNSPKTATSSVPLQLPEVAPAVNLTPPRIAAEAVPADVALTSVQKHSLQKLLDQQMKRAEVTEPMSQLDEKPEVAVTFVEEFAEESINEASDALENFATHESQVLELDEAETIDALIDEPDQEVAAEELHINIPQSHREHWSNGLPDWGSQRFDVLLFSCRKVNLAIPLILLGHIYLERGSLSQMPNQPSWILGLKATGAGNLKVIDAGAYFMPERGATLDIDDELHIVSLAGSQWAFAVDAVANPITMTIDDVQWRSLSAQSPWLAGAIKREMCVLIDPPALLCELERQRTRS